MMGSTKRQPILAVCYDFDYTLSPQNMQDGYISSLGADVAEFWKKSNDFAKDNNMDSNSAYMYLMLDLARGKIVLNRENLAAYGSSIELYPGVTEWFDRINAYGRLHGITVEHYILSSGLREMIDGTSIRKHFRAVFASSYYYNDRGEPKWPAQVINYTNKTQFLFRIEKDILDVNSMEVNKHYEEGEVRVPFRNIVYMGDSRTDIPCMKLVNSMGGHSIGIYENGQKKEVYDLVKDQRIRYFAEADYREGSRLDTLLKAIIEKTESYEKLENLHLEDMREYKKDRFERRELRFERADLQS